MKRIFSITLPYFEFVLPYFEIAEHMHRNERQHEPENTIMGKDNEQQGQDSGCNTAPCYAERIEKSIDRFKQWYCCLPSNEVQHSIDPFVDKIINTLAAIKDKA